MQKRLFTFLSISLVLIITMLFIGCQSDGERKTINQRVEKGLDIYVFPMRKNCDAGAGWKKCLQVAYTKPVSPDDWHLFYDEIEGFNFEEGTMYHLSVFKNPKQGDIPEDTGNFDYKLDRVIETFPNMIDTTMNQAYLEAALKGVYYRATGTEPFWYLEMVPGQHIRLTRMEDRTPVDLAYKKPEKQGDKWFYSGRKDGIKYTLEIFDTPCQDQMSGEEFPTQIEINYRGETLVGCGMFLENNLPF